MKPVLAKWVSYPIFLWITTCKILFIVGDNVGKTPMNTRLCIGRSDKKSRLIMLLFLRRFLCTTALNVQNGCGYFLSNLWMPEWSFNS
ncbi:hypothetical protein C7M51_02588 [Mixta intestinalis]|uniref:Uncharacterized protein n=1 Tax=Mixta intestinalis TaxID=1615494 RepID=A0A6P1Q2B2_9GAMM|nr:hypothetical protein C7M51_02588 [Mixta intestinalis]